MCRLIPAALPGSSSPTFLDKLDPPSDPPDSSPSRTRLEASGTMTVVSARPHLQPARPYPDESRDQPGIRPGAAALAGQKRHRIEHSEAGHGGGGSIPPQMLLQQLYNPISSMKQETGSSSSQAVPQELAGGSSSRFMHLAEASPPVPWAPVLLDATVEPRTVKIERSTSTYSSSPSLTPEPFTNLELDSARNVVVSDVRRPPAATEGTCQILSLPS